MKEHLFLAVTKIALLVVIAVLLLFVFIANNETQTKVVETARRVDDVRDQVAEVRRMMGQGVRTVAGSEAPPPSDDRKPRIEGYTVLLSPEPDRPRPPDDQIDFDAQLRLGTLSEPKGLNILTSDRDYTVGTELGYYLYTPLAERKDANKDEFKPGLAVRVEESPDHREFYIWLREGVKWHRPPVDLTDPKYEWMRGDHEVTSEDVIFSLDMILNERADTDSLRPEFRDVQEYKALDRYTVRIVWKEPNFYSRGVLLGDLLPMPKWIYAFEEDGTPIDPAGLGQRFASHWFNKKMCGYGAYTFKEYKQGDSILLERNEQWWGRRPGYKTIRYQLALREDEPRYNRFMSFDDKGNRDQAMYPMSSTRLKRDIFDNDGSSELLKQLAEKKLYIYAYQRMMYAYQGWQCKSKLFGDPRVRRAMTLATNRKAWQKEIFLNQAIFPTGIAFTESPEYDRTVKPWPYDLDAAKRLLEEAGWKDTDGNGVLDKVIDGEKREFRFKLLKTSGNSPEIDATTQDWQQSLRKIGVIMELDPAEWNLFIKKVQDREFEAYSMAWYHGDDFDPKTVFHSRLIDIPGSNNFVQWSNKRADEIIDLLNTTFDLPKRYELCHELHRIFHEEQPYTNLWSWRNSVAIDSRVGGLENPRNFTPQIALFNLYQLKQGPAPYGDGRYERPTR